MKKTLAVVLTIAFVFSGCSGYKDCRSSAVTAQAKRACAIAEAYKQLKVSNETRDSLIHAAGDAYRAGLIDDDDKESMRAAVVTFDREHDRMADLLKMAVRTETDPMGVTFGLARVVLELLEAAKSAGVGK